MRSVVLMAILLAPLMGISQFVNKSTVAPNGKTVGFLEYKPANYSTVTTKYPLIIFLHGIGERGNGTTELVKVKYQGIPKNIAAGNTMTFTWNGKTETFLVLAPQCSKTDTLWYSYYIDAMLNYAKANLRVDTNRIILTGLSMGGGGVWMYSSASVTNAARFAALSPICGACLMNNGANIAKGKPAVYAFHALDDTVSVALPICTINAIKSINANNPPIKAVATYYPTGRHNIWGRAYDTTYTFQNPNIYEWMLNQNKSLPANKVPIPDAGKDTMVLTSSGKAVLNGTLSKDLDGTILRYIWRKISGPTAGVLSNSTKSIASLSGLAAGTYLYELKVIDSRASWAMDTMKVIVAATNAAPKANAGVDGLVNLPATTFTLKGSGTDTDGSISYYTWTKVAGPTSFKITSPTSATTAVSLLVAGTYTFRLTVKDIGGLTASDDVLVVVNQLPVARAGADSTTKLPKNTTTLIGTATDADGTIASVNWARISGPTNYTILSPASLRTGISNLVAGTYLFRLTAKDNRGALGYDTVKVTVLAATAQAAPVQNREKDAETLRSASLLISPTLVRNSVRVEINSPLLGATSIRIHDMNGKELRRVQFSKDTRTVQRMIETSALSAGTYHVEVVIAGKERLVGRMVKE